MRTTIKAAAAICGALAALAAVSAVAAETPKNEALYMSDAQFQGIEKKIPAKDGKAGEFSARMFNARTYSMSFIRLSAPDTPHAHGAWSEAFVVREGSGVLETGGTITGVTGTDSATHKSMFVDAQGNPLRQGAAPPPSATPRQPTPGDLAGTGIDGGHRQAVKAGDVILVPAGVAHRWVQVDQPVVYLDIKFPKAE
jgi:mannose-6-phosphate isomerase-like protein (cupin superfamily)